MRVHLIDGTYELFRQHFGRPEPSQYGATIGVIRSTMNLIAQGATHVAVASDHVIESFRNELWPTYKTSEGMPPELLMQIPVMEDALGAIGITVWPMVEHEADDALGAAALVADLDERVEQVIICTPDKDLGQCVKGQRIVQLDRRKGEVVDEDGVRAKFGVGPASIPDWLGLVGDAADGFPGLPGWGAKSASAVLARYEHLEAVPRLGERWDVEVRGAAKLANTLHEQMAEALLFRQIATVVTDLDVGAVDDWEWKGPVEELKRWAVALEMPSLASEVRRAQGGG